MLVVNIGPAAPDQGGEVLGRPVETPTDDELSQLNPSPISKIVRLGQEAMVRKRRAWDDWLAIAEALQVGRAEVMHELHTNDPHGRRYEKAMSNWLIAHSFNEIDKGIRKRLLDCLKHKIEIAEWRARLTDAERFSFNHPDTVLRKWKAATAVPDPNAPQKVSAVQKLKDELVSVVKELDRYKREVERGGGDLWDRADHVKDIAKVMIDQLGKAKVEKVAHTILAALKAGSGA
jgi:hypothetical protein